MRVIPEDLTALRTRCGTKVTDKLGATKVVPLDSRKMLLESSNKGASLLPTLPEPVHHITTIIPKADLIPLYRTLLEFAGNGVVFPDEEEDLDFMLSYGQFWLGRNLKMMKGRPNQCHANTSELFLNNHDVTRICTGYALSEDGLWRCHSWLMWIKPRSCQIVETTVKRLAYYGFVMNESLSLQFASANTI